MSRYDDDGLVIARRRLVTAWCVVCVALVALVVLGIWSWHYTSP